MHWHMRLGLAIALLAPTWLAAQEKNDLLEETRTRQKIASAALEQEIVTSLEEADRLKDRPAQAADILRAALKKLESDKTLSAGRRTALASGIKDRLKEFNRDP